MIKTSVHGQPNLEESNYVARGKTEPDNQNGNAKNDKIDEWL